MEPIVHGLEADYSEQVEFIYIDIDKPDSQEAKDKYGFRYQPHFILVDGDGEVVQEWFGYNSPNVFEEAFADLGVN